MTIKSLALLAATVLTLSLWGCELPKPPRTLEELEMALKADEDQARLAALELITFLAGNRTADERAVAYRALLEKGKLVGTELVALCADPKADPSTREHALALAANLKLAGAFEAAKKALADEDFKRNHAAAWALGELGRPEAIPKLVDALTTSAYEITAKAAARALARFGAEAVEPLVEGLTTMPPERQGYALRNLGELRSPAGRPALENALKEPLTRADAVWALGTMGKLKELEPIDLVPYLDDPDWRVRVECSRSVGLLRDEGAVEKLDELRRTDEVMAVREWAARGLSLIKGEPQPYLDRLGQWVTPDSLYH